MANQDVISKWTAQNHPTPPSHSSKRRTGTRSLVRPEESFTILELPSSCSKVEFKFHKILYCSAELHTLKTSQTLWNTIFTELLSPQNHTYTISISVGPQYYRLQQTKMDTDSSPAPTRAFRNTSETYWNSFMANVPISILINLPPVPPNTSQI